MVQVIEIESGRLGYSAVIDHVLHHGKERDSRAGPTIDAGWTTVRLSTPYDALPIGVGRFINRKIAAAEAVQLIGGFSDPGILSPHFDRYREDDGTLHGAYGPRVAHQVSTQLRKLSRDRDTRQAVITVWDPARDNDTTRRDVPCTVTIGLRLEVNRLDMHVVMRSNDVFMGTPYDFFQFAQLQLTAARCLGVLPGRYMHTAWSLHLYTRDRERAAYVYPGRSQDDVDTPAGLPVTGTGDAGARWNHTAARTRKLSYESETIQGMNTDELWFRRALTDR